jgi:hypothetical protein
MQYQLKSCAVLDLDSTLVHTFGNDYTWKFIDFDENKRLKDRVFDIKFSGVFKWGTIRPGTEKFLNTCFEVFDMVGVWSAGTYDYVHKIVDEIFPRSPDFVWTKDDCVPSIYSQDEDHNENINKVVQKPLEKLLLHYPDINPKQILIFDDYLDVCEQNALYHVHVPAWEGTFDTLNACDPTLTKLARWLPSLKNYEDYKFASPKI